jgi:hypothetical protein
MFLLNEIFQIRTGIVLNDNLETLPIKLRSLFMYTLLINMKLKLFYNNILKYIIMYLNNKKGVNH